MSTATVKKSGNVLIDALPNKDSALIIAQSNLVELCSGDVLQEINHPIHYIYFPLNGFISLIAPETEHPLFSGALIGREGMVGASLALGIKEAPWRSIVYGGGVALRISSAKWKKILRERLWISTVTCRYLYALMKLGNRMTACSCFHEVNSRLARLLLMAQDRAESALVQLTHQQLADMLGVQRSAVSLAAEELQKKQCIHYSRGTITVLDRSMLRSHACSCYTEDIRDHGHLFHQV